MTKKILIVDDEPITIRLVRAALAKTGYEILSASNGREAFESIQAKKPDLIILDVMLPDINGFEICARLRQDPLTKMLPVMMLTTLNTVEEKVKGFQAGADDYLPKPFSPDELLMRVQVLIRRSEPLIEAQREETQGKLISVFSLRGGVGVSTLASNLAAGLTKLWDTPAVLVDLVLASGQCALMLNMPFYHSWDDLSWMPIDEIETEQVEQVLLQHTTGTRLLASSPDPEKAEILSADVVNKVLALLRRRYRHIIVDLPHDFSDLTIAALDQSDLIIGVMAPELASVRAMGIALKTFEKLGYDPEKTFLILNWIFQKNGLAKKDIEAALHHPIKLVMPFAPEPLVNSINMGVPVVVSEQETPLSAFFEDFAFLISDDSLRKKRPASPTTTWQAVYHRMKQRQPRK